MFTQRAGKNCIPLCSRTVIIAEARLRIPKQNIVRIAENGCYRGREGKNFFAQILYVTTVQNMFGRKPQIIFFNGILKTLQTVLTYAAVRGFCSDESHIGVPVLNKMFCRETASLVIVNSDVGNLTERRVTVCKNNGNPVVFFHFLDIFVKDTQ